MADKDTVMETEEKEVVSRNFIEQEIDKDLAEGEAYDSYQFVRNGFFCVDCKDSTPQKPVFNRIVSLKSSFKLPK